MFWSPDRGSRRLLTLIAATTLIAAACTSSGEDPSPRGGTASGSPGEGSAATSSSNAGTTRPESCGRLDVYARRVARGYVPHRGADIVPIPAQQTYIGGAAAPLHTGPWDHLTDVPLVAYGPGVVPEAGRVGTPATMADVAPTVARMLGYRFHTQHGRVIEEIVGDPSKPPRLIVVIVWDGGGWNVLNHHDDAWPFLRRVRERGAWLDDFEIGSTPSNTPPIHTTLGTGVFPSRHGIPGVRMMKGRNDAYVNPFLGARADFVRVPSLGDLYDRSNGNEPKVGLVGTVDWHLGMLGHGSRFPGGDADVAVLLGSSGELFGDPSTYELSPTPDLRVMHGAVDRLDASDGERDGKWGRDDLGDPAIRAASPAWVEFQQDLLEDTITRHRFGREDMPDLLFTNFKMVDDAGHKWAPFSRQVGAAIAASDAALRRLTRFLDESVGERRWAILLTADHGQQPLSADTGIFPVQPAPLEEDVNQRFDDNDNGRSLVQRVTAAGLFVDVREAKALGVTLAEIAEWLIDYTAEDNTRPGKPLPKAWRDDPQRRLFAGVVVGDRLVADSCD